MRTYTNADVLGKIIEILDHRFGGSWHRENFMAEDYDVADSINVINETVEYLRQYDGI